MSQPYKRRNIPPVYDQQWFLAEFGNIQRSQADGPYLPLSGGTLTGTVSGTIFASSSAAWTMGDVSGAARVLYGAGAFSVLNTSNGYADFYAGAGVFSGVIAAAGNGPNNFIATGSPTDVLQLRFGDSSVIGAVGTAFSSGAPYASYNAYQTTKSADAWASNYTGVRSMLSLLSSVGWGLYTAAAGHAAGTLSAFWGSTVAAIDYTGAMTLAGDLANSGNASLAGSGGRVGFFGSAGAVKQTGITTFSQLLAACQAYGLVS